MFEVTIGLALGLILGYAYRSMSQDRLPAGPGGVVARLEDWHANEAADVLITAEEVELVGQTFRSLEGTVANMSERIGSLDTARVEAVKAATNLAVELEAARRPTVSTVTIAGVTLRPTTGTVVAPAAAATPKPVKAKAAPKVKAAPKAKAPAKARKR